MNKKEVIEMKDTTVGKLIKCLQALPANEKIIDFKVEFAYRPFGLCVIKKNDDDE